MQRAAPAGTNGKRFFIHTFGCQMNSADSERMAGVLEASGYECTTDASKAHVLIYNTCSIRDKAERKVYSALGRQAQRKREHFKDVTIVVAGCVAQQEGKALLRRVPEVDVVMGPQHANRIAALVEEAEHGQARPCAQVLDCHIIRQPERVLLHAAAFQTHGHGCAVMASLPQQYICACKAQARSVGAVGC